MSQAADKQNYYVVLFTFLVFGRRHSVYRFEAPGEIRTAAEADMLGYFRNIHVRFFK